VTNTAVAKAAEADRPATRGVQHDPAKRATVYYLALLTSAVAICGAVPAVKELIDHFRAFESTGIENWAHILLLLAAIQLAYAAYSALVPDWGTLWVLAIFSVLVAAFYASGLAVFMFARSENLLLATLDLADEQFHGQGTRWCFLMLCLTLLLTYFYGRVSTRWHKAYVITADTASKARSKS
jgi:hypothetical protein